MQIDEAVILVWSHRTSSKPHGKTREFSSWTMLLFSQGADHLTVTWKVDEGVYQHVDVREEGKENAFSLGRSLWIDSEVGSTATCIYVLVLSGSILFG